MAIAPFDEIAPVDDGTSGGAAARAAGDRPPRWWQRKRVILPLALAVYAGLAVLLNFDVWRSPATRCIGGGGADPQQNMWFLSWTQFAITHGHNLFFSDYMRYPQGINLLWQTSILLPGLVLAPVTAIWGSVVSYNVLMTGSLALAAWLAFIVIRRYVAADLAAAAGGLLYGFSPYAIAQSQGHTNLVVSLITPPLALLVLDELVIRQRLRTWVIGLLAAALCIAQFFIAEEVLATEVIAAAVVVVILGLFHRHQIRPRLGYAVRALLIGGGVAAVLLAFPLATQFFGAGRVSGVIHDPQAFVTDPTNFFVPTQIQLIAPHQAISLTSVWSGNISEWDGYLGLPLIALVIFCLTRYWKLMPVRVTVLSGMAMAVLSLGGYVHFRRHSLPIPLPWRLAEHLPVLNNALPSRLMMYSYLAGGLLLAFALHRLWTQWHNHAANLALATAVLIPLVPHVPLDSTPLNTPAYFTGSGVKAIPQGAAVMSVPWADSTVNVETMHGQAASGMRFRLLGGYYIGDDDPSQAALKSTITEMTTKGIFPTGAGVDALRGELKASRVGAVIVEPVANQSAVVAFFAALLGPPSQTSDGINVWVLPNS
jgi:hypothetical protein